jgi:hypothetical protein
MVSLFDDGREAIYDNGMTMTLTVTLELPPEAAARLQTGIAQRDTESVRQLLIDALAPTVEALLQAPDLPDDEWEAVAARLADELAACVGPDAPTLPDEALSRAGIYEDHP